MSLGTIIVGIFLIGFIWKWKEVGLYEKFLVIGSLALLGGMQFANNQSDKEFNKLYKNYQANVSTAHSPSKAVDGTAHDEHFHSLHEKTDKKM